MSPRQDVLDPHRTPARRRPARPGDGKDGPVDSRRTVVDVWVLDPHAWDPALVRRVLDPVETSRAALLPAGQADRFVLARALLRGALGARLGRPAAEVVLRAVCPACGGQHGRVLVGGTSPTVHVSLTRSGPLLGVALTQAGPVGLDIESVAAVAAAPLADVALPPARLAAHRRLPHDAATAALARTWVITEAALKARGTGLRLDPAHVDLAGLTVLPLSLGSDLAGAVVLAVSPPARWWLPGGLGNPQLHVHEGGAVLDRLLDGR